MQCDGSLRNIEKEIIRECAHKNIQVYENFLSYYIKLLSLDPSWGVTEDYVSRQKIQNLIKYVVSKLENQLTPQMITLKMQFYFSCNFEMKQKLLQKNRNELLERLKTLEQEIIDVKQLEDEEDFDVMYKKIVFYVTLASGLGNPLIEGVFKEAKAALMSILDQEELKEFLLLPKFSKIENLAEFTKLVTGIRLFNKDCGKGGDGMENLPKLMDEALDATNLELQHGLITIMDKVNLLTTALDYIYLTELDERDQFIIVASLPKEVSLNDVEYVKDSLILYRQHELFIRKLIDEVDKIDATTRQTCSSLKEALMNLHQVVKHRIAIPPHFLKLADIWCSLQDHAVLLAKVNQIMANLQKYVKILAFDDNVAELMLPPGELPMTDTERLQRSAKQKISSAEFGAQLLEPKIFKDVDKVKLEYLGFCAWKIFRTNGALLPGNPHLGVGRTMNMNFAFSSVEAAKAFGASPEKCVMETIKLARRKPEIINLLNIKNRLILVQNIVELFKEPLLPPITDDASVQTDLHPIERNIDPNYFSNIWDWKRKALKYANLSHCATVTTQTKASCYRANFSSQCYGQKEKEVQTKRDNYTNVPRPSTFIFGLRGRNNNKQFVVDLTRSVNE